MKTTYSKIYIQIDVLNKSSRWCYSYSVAHWRITMIWCVVHLRPATPLSICPLWESRWYSAVRERHDCVRLPTYGYQYNPFWYMVSNQHPNEHGNILTLVHYYFYYYYSDHQSVTRSLIRFFCSVFIQYAMDIYVSIWVECENRDV